MPTTTRPSKKPVKVLFFLSCAVLVGGATAMYCEDQSCYDVLGVSRDATQKDVRAAYKAASLKFHPDKNPGDASASAAFARVAAAYETLGDEGRRAEYDDVLDHPERHVFTHWRYFARRSFLIDWRLVVGSLVALASAAEYALARQRYRSLVCAAKRTPIFVAKAKRLAAELERERGKVPLSEGRKGSKTERIRSKASSKATAAATYNEAVELLERDLVFDGGRTRAPTFADTIAVRLALAPIRFTSWAASEASWQWRYSLCKREVLAHDAGEATRRALNVSAHRWASVPDDKKDELAQQRLWIRANLDRFKHRRR